MVTPRMIPIMMMMMMMMIGMVDPPLSMDPRLLQEDRALGTPQQQKSMRNPSPRAILHTVNLRDSKRMKLFDDHVHVDPNHLSLSPVPNGPVLQPALEKENQFVQEDQPMHVMHGNHHYQPHPHHHQSHPYHPSLECQTRPEALSSARQGTALDEINTSKEDSSG